MPCPFRTILKEILRTARYHLLFAFRLLYSTDPLPRMNSHDMRRYAEGLMEVLWDDTRSKTMFDKTKAHVRAVATGNLHRDNIRTEPFTNALKKRIEQQ